MNAKAKTRILKAIREHLKPHIKYPNILALKPTYDPFLELTTQHPIQHPEEPVDIRLNDNRVTGISVDLEINIATDLNNTTRVSIWTPQTSVHIPLEDPELLNKITQIIKCTTSSKPSKTTSIPTTQTSESN